MFDCLIFITHVALVGSTIELSIHGQSESPRLLARLTIPTSSFAPLENFPISIEISNPTTRTVELRGPAIGICHPSILRHAEGDWTPLRCSEESSSSSLVVVALSPGGTKRVDRFLYYQFDLDRWPQSAGNYLIRLNMSEYVGRYAGEDSWETINWETRDVEVRVGGGSELNRTAAAFLRDSLSEFRQGTRNGTEHRDYLEFSIDLFEKFLSKYDASSYSSEIRFRLADALIEVIGNPKEPLPAEKHQKFLRLCEENVMWCLSAGPPYSSDWLSWDWDRGGNRVFELAYIHRRLGLLVAMAEKLDQTDADPASILFRRAARQKLEGRIEDLRATVGSLESNFPNHKATEWARDLVSSE